jgi:7,8-dihydro-6-hydroxymethylpterin-pyrophosphokinase
MHERDFVMKPLNEIKKESGEPKKHKS